MESCGTFNPASGTIVEQKLAKFAAAVIGALERPITNDVRKAQAEARAEDQASHLQTSHLWRVMDTANAILQLDDLWTMYAPNVFVYTLLGARLETDIVSAVGRALSEMAGETGRKAMYLVRSGQVAF